MFIVNYDALSFPWATIYTFNWFVSSLQKSIWARQSECEGSVNFGLVPKKKTFEDVYRKRKLQTSLGNVLHLPVQVEAHKALAITINKKLNFDIFVL